MVSDNSGVSSYVINDRLFPMLVHPTSGADSLDFDVCCPVCEGKHSREKSPTRYVRSVSSLITQAHLIFILESLSDFSVLKGIPIHIIYSIHVNQFNVYIYVIRVHVHV